MAAFLARRFLLMIPTLWAILTLTFFLVHAAPGGPFLAERDIPKEAKEALEAKYGLDQPLLVQYGRYLAHTIRFDFGPSYKHPARDVREIIFQTLPVSLTLGGLAMLVALAVGVPLGVLAAWRQNTAQDYAAMSVALFGLSVPNFVLGPLLVLVFSLSLFLFPPALWHGPAFQVLPVLTLAAIYTAYIARLTRGGMLEVMQQDFIRTARAKGLNERDVVLRHALKPGMLPVVSFLGPATANIVTGSIAVESIFAVPGLGSQLKTAAFNRDYTLVLGIVLFYAIFLLVLNLLVDLAYTRIDPRVELG
jgi:oligopeptide transport system permease protein